MFRMLTLLVGAIAAVVLVTNVPEGSASPVMSATYYGCLPGYDFQVMNSEYARCFKPATTTTANIVCSPGFVKVIDQYSDKRDACLKTNDNSLALYTCPSSYSKKVQAGPDICVKLVAADSKAPSQPKTF